MRRDPLTSPVRPSTFHETSESAGHGFAVGPSSLGRERAPDYRPFGDRFDPLYDEPEDAVNREPSRTQYAEAASRPSHDRDRVRREDFDDERAGSVRRAGGGAAIDRPLIDLAVIMASIWRFRWVIAATTMIGVVLGVLFALSTPHHYSAVSRLFIDPRDVQLTDADIDSKPVSGDTMLTIIDSQVQIVGSADVLRTVAADLDLASDPDFMERDGEGGILTWFGLAGDVTDNSGGDGEQRTVDALADALTIAREPKTFVIDVVATTRDPQMAATIANRVVETYLDSESSARSGLMKRATQALDGRLSSLRTDLEAAENTVETFKAEHDIVDASGQSLQDSQILALTNQLANARAETVTARSRAQSVRQVQLGDVLKGAIPEDVESQALTDLRKTYAETKAQADSLGSQMGPRHPRLIAARSALSSVRNEIRAQLDRISASTQTQLKRAEQTEEDLASRLAAAKERSQDTSVEMVQLRELERKATATRQIYEALLARSRQTTEQQRLITQNVRVIASAQPPLHPSGPSRKLIAIAGAVLGLAAGLAFACLHGVLACLRLSGVGGTSGDGGATANPDAPPRVSRSPERKRSRFRMPFAANAATRAPAVAEPDETRPNDWRIRATDAEQARSGRPAIRAHGPERSSTDDDGRTRRRA